MFERRQNFPLLKGKAAELRHLLKPMLRVCEAFLDAGDRIHQQIVMALRKLIVLEDILTAHRDAYKLPADVASLFEKNCQDFLL